jgi:hypothetical protein
MMKVPHCARVQPEPDPLGFTDASKTCIKTRLHSKLSVITHSAPLLRQCEQSGRSREQRSLAVRHLLQTSPLAVAVLACSLLSAQLSSVDSLGMLVAYW